MIRFWNETDIKKIAKIEEDCFKSPWNENMLKSEYVNPLFKCIVFESGNEIFGYLGFWELSGQIDIANIAVVKTMRKKGIAKQLIAFLIKFCKENSIFNLSLEVNEQNIAAVNLYLSFGFKAEGLRRGYYENNENALIMWLHLKE